MFEEPYRWVEAIRHRREYLEDQLSGGSPVVGLSWKNGAVLATAESATQKIYEIYDQIAFGGIGHPSDLEKLRATVLETAHIEGFNRSPGDVNLQRLIKFGIAPVIKQAFEEILHSPFIARLLFVEISIPSRKPYFLRINYDGIFDESSRDGILAPTSALSEKMSRFIQAQNLLPDLALDEAVQWAMRTWAISKLPSGPEENGESPGGETQKLDRLIRENLSSWKPEISVLDLELPGTSKYRTLSTQEITACWR
ncbi:MAG TPA: hypothetical protein VN944_08285 [Nitrospiria bacterium]|nr:hypothetical protein [Nitrospiria bacterium]